MSVIEQADLRPPRTTQRFGLPIPGDAGPADYVTATGALADAVDNALHARQGRVTEITRLDGLDDQLPHNPDTGDKILVHFWGPGFHGGEEPVSNFANWEFVFSPEYGGWLFVGGTPCKIVDTAAPGPRGSGDGRWQLVGPWCHTPFPNMWAHIGFGARFGSIDSSQVWGIVGGPGSEQFVGGPGPATLEVGFTSSIQMFNWGTPASAGFLQFPLDDPGGWLGLFAAATPVATYFCQHGWLSITPDLIPHPVQAATTRAGRQWPPPPPTLSPPLDPSEWPPGMPPLPPLAEGPPMHVPPMPPHRPGPQEPRA
jgi:hypothetical protein